MKHIQLIMAENVTIQRATLTLIIIISYGLAVPHLHAQSASNDSAQTTPAKTDSPARAATKTNDEGAQKEKTAAAPAGKATESTQLSRVVVTADQGAADAAKQDVNRTPGAAHVLDTSDLFKTQTTSLTAASQLQYTPGVFAQSSGGNQGFRLSIRGSSLVNTNFYKYGVGLYFNGLFFPGIAESGAPPFLFEPLATNYTVVLPGQNAFDLQTIDLGGAINFVDYTGYDAAPLQVRFDAGSYSYYKGQVSSGLVEGPFDYYVSVSQSSDQGFQDHSAELGSRVIGNIGYQINPDIQNRFYFRYGAEYFQYGGLLTNAQIASNPRQAQVSQKSQDVYLDSPISVYVGDKATIKLDPDSQLELGLAYDYSYMYKNSKGVLNGFATDYTEQNFTPSALYSRSDELFGHQDKSLFAIRGDTVVNSKSHAFDYSVPTSPTYGAIIRKHTNSGTSEAVISGSNDFEIIPKLWVKTGISGIYTRMVNVDSESRNTTTGAYLPINNANQDQGRFDYNGVLGLHYDFNPDTQIFLNLSRSVDSTTGESLGNSSFTGENQIKNQTATTVEIGTRAKVGIFDGSLSLYHSAVENEILTVATQINPTLITITSNATPTTHQGIEAKLDTTLWQGHDSTDEAPNRLLLIQAYTYSDFYYNDDPVWHHNHLPAIPNNFYQAELRYEHPTGFYVGVNTQYRSQIWEDYANTTASPGYATLGAKVGYAPPRQPWEVHLQFTNLTNEHYAAYVQQTSNLTAPALVGTGVAAPGDGFGIYGGASYHF